VRRRKRDLTVSLDATDDRHSQPLGATLRNDDAVDPEQETLAKSGRSTARGSTQLRRSYREAVILRDVEGFSYEEVAATLQISIGTVKSRISRAEWRCAASSKDLCNEEWLARPASQTRCQMGRSDGLGTDETAIQPKAE